MGARHWDVSVREGIGGRMMSWGEGGDYAAENAAALFCERVVARRAASSVRACASMRREGGRLGPPTRDGQ